MRAHSVSLLALLAAAACCVTPEQEPIGTSPDAIRVCAGANVLEGIDVWNQDGVIDWAQVAALGRQLAGVLSERARAFRDVEPLAIRRRGHGPRHHHRL